MDDKIPNPFHAGELRAQHLAGGGPAGTGIRNWMPDQHRIFFGQLPFICMAVNGADGWPLATLLTGTPGFVLAPTPDRLEISALPAADDPTAAAIRTGAAVGLLGIELPTRRRNRANGEITRVSGGLSIAIEESFGNCPKYITPRTLEAVGKESGAMEISAGLSAQARSFIATSDTMFVATSGASHGGLDISHRGGAPGFIQVEGDTLLVPDYPGNRYFNTLGNMLVEPRCALVLVDFTNGDILQLQGRAEVLWGRQAPGDPMSVNSWRFHVVRSWLRPGAFPLTA